MQSAYDIARDELGVKESFGKKDNPRVVEYHATTSAKRTPDSVAWCSSFVNWCVVEAGGIGTGRRLARSWLKWGVPVELSAARPGDVVVLWRDSLASVKGHVGFFVRRDADQVILLGGNQANSVCERGYPASRVLGVRRGV